jgi:protein-L-isoaspartate(D-aspartate) O-methyltransferase
MDFTESRERMVEQQLIPRGISDPPVLKILKKVERHKFVPKELLDNSYGDYPLPIGEGQTISQPYIVALMTQSLRLKSEEKVLEIGTGSGYQTAVLAELSAKVYSVERISLLAEKAIKILSELGYKNIEIKVGDGSLGWEEGAPYDAIMVTASCPGRPTALLNQLADGGRLIAPIGDVFGQILTLFEKRGNSIASQEICGCVFVPLIGKEGWTR